MAICLMLHVYTCDKHMTMHVYHMINQSASNEKVKGQITIPHPSFDEMTDFHHLSSKNSEYMHYYRAKRHFPYIC